jgi:hypothetical protein
LGAKVVQQEGGFFDWGSMGVDQSAAEEMTKIFHKNTAEGISR